MNYSESGHRKGPSDGIGAVLKRTAGTFVNQPNFETFSNLLENNLKNIIIEIIAGNHNLHLVFHDSFTSY